jgi:hypothetical protein
MKTLSDSISCIGFTLLFYLTLAFFGLFVCGCWAFAVGDGTGLQIFALLFIGGLFTLTGTFFLNRIWDNLLGK